MKRVSKIALISIVSLFLMASAACGQTPDKGASQAPAVFVASTPCTSGTRPLPGIAADAGCELMLWKLELKSGESPRAGTYILDCDYGIPKQGTKGLINGGKHLHREGKWVVTNGAKMNPKAIVYRLDPDQPQASVSFIRLNDSVLHLLDADSQLMIGTGGWSYTLNRVKQ